MAIKVRILSMLLTIHSLGLLFASLFTYRWYVDDQKEVGVFGMCEVANKTSVNRMILVANRTNARSASHLPFQVDSLFATSFRSFSLLSSSGGENKSMTCYKLLWPTSDEAFAYLANNSVYLTAMMGVAIGSATLGSLALLWSFVCVIFRSIGAHPRASELLIALTVLTDAAVITTYGLFVFKDGHLTLFSSFGFSFWMSVGASCGFFLAAIFFTVDRVNTGFKYKLDSYQKKYNEG